VARLPVRPQIAERRDIVNIRDLGVTLVRETMSPAENGAQVVIRYASGGWGPKPKPKPKPKTDDKPKPKPKKTSGYDGITHAQVEQLKTQLQRQLH
jgi:hypothetical protein